MEHIELPGGVGADLHGHADAVAAVVPHRGRDQRQVAGALAQVLGQHLLAALEAPAGDHHRRGGELAQEAVAATGHDPVDASLRREAEAHRLGLIEDLRARSAVHHLGQAVDDPHPAPRRHAEASAGVAVRKRLLEEHQLHAIGFEEAQGGADLALQGAAVVEVGHAARDGLHLGNERRVQAPVLGDTEPGAGPAGRAAPAFARGPFEHGDARRAAHPSRRLGIAHRSAKPGGAAAQHHQIVSVVSPLRSHAAFPSASSHSSGRASPALRRCRQVTRNGSSYSTCATHSPGFVAPPKGAGPRLDDRQPGALDGLASSP